VNATGIITVSACPTATITDNGMNTYNTVSIGTQCWMKENLRVRRYNDGTEIRFDASGGVLGTTSQTWAGTGREYGAFTIYANDSTGTPSNLTSYGYLYNWYAAKGIYKTGVIVSTDTLNICPSGWHVPSDSDWNKLVIFIDSGTPAADTTITGTQSTTAGGMLKSTLLWASPNTGATNPSVFSALPGGYRESTGRFFRLGTRTFFWSATEYDTTAAWHRVLYNNSGTVDRLNTIITKSFGASVRCLRD
jgi:uncharacterized protein (TIGR02145 family)